MTESIGIFAAIFELLGVYLLGLKKPSGFISGLCGNLLWVGYVCIAQNTFGLLLVCLVALGLNIKGWRNWNG